MLVFKYSLASRKRSKNRVKCGLLVIASHLLQARMADDTTRQSAELWTGHREPDRMNRLTEKQVSKAASGIHLAITLPSVAAISSKLAKRCPPTSSTRPASLAVGPAGPLPVGDRWR